MIGVPADEMKASIDRYNELVTKGADDDFHKPSDFLYPVMKAPFYAAKVGIALLAVVGGLSVNTDLQVLNDKNSLLHVCMLPATPLAICMLSTIPSTWLATPTDAV